MSEPPNLSRLERAAERDTGCRALAAYAGKVTASNDVQQTGKFGQSPINKQDRACRSTQRNQLPQQDDRKIDSRAAWNRIQAQPQRQRIKIKQDEHQGCPVRQDSCNIMHECQDKTFSSRFYERHSLTATTSCILPDTQEAQRLCL